MESILPKKEIITDIDGRKLKLSNLDKILFPDLGVVKAELIQYYIKIAPYILPHLIDRPLTLIRYPDGVQGKRFYSKNRPSWTPEWMQCVQLDEEDDNFYLLANDLPSLAWIANLAALELHPMQVTSMLPHNPDYFIFDLDPPKQADFEVVQQLALRLKPFLESFGYTPYLKTSGGKGLHIYVPIFPNYPQAEVFDTVKNMARQFIKTDKTTTLKLNKEKREGKVLLDIYRNHRSQTCVAPYSTRGKSGAPISTPIFWKELTQIKSSQAFTIQTIFQKIELDGDPWKDFITNKTHLHTDKSNRAKISTSTIKKKTTPGVSSLLDRIALKPMLATLGTKIPNPKDYLFEIKWDGIRVLVKKEKDHVAVISRNGNDLTEKFPIIKKEIGDQKLESFLGDGELLVFNKDGKPNFSKIVGRMHSKSSSGKNGAPSRDKATLYLFDLLYAEGKDLRGETLETRRTYLKTNFTWNANIKFSSSFEDGKQLFDAIKAQNMEGIMAKKKGSTYQCDTRSSHWIKIKVQNEDQALIIGYTKGKGDRSQLFGALHLGKIENGKLVYFGKIGTGFSISRMKEIKAILSDLKKTKKPFKENIEDKDTIWVEPAYTCTLKYASFTTNDTYREPVFIDMHKTTENS